MYRYDWAGLTLTSDVDLRELRPPDPEGADREAWRIKVSGDPLSGRAPRRWFHRWRLPDGQRWLSLARDPDGYLLRFHGLADFHVSVDARRILGHRLPDTPTHTFTHLLLDQVLPLVIGGPDRLALHASVVSVDGMAAAFVGATGQGKSTLAAALARRGHLVLSDDCCVICRTPGGFEVAPTYAGLRLFPETIHELFGGSAPRHADVSHYSTKQRIVPVTAGPSVRLPRVPLRRIYTLATRPVAAPVAEVLVSERPPRDGVLDVVGATFYLDVWDARRAREGFELAVAAASSCSVRLLTLPWNLGALDEGVKRIVDDLRR